MCGVVENSQKNRIPGLWILKGVKAQSNEKKKKRGKATDRMKVKRGEESKEQSAAHAVMVEVSRHFL